ncbi:hypothetical protein PFISCL1PPCAC_12874, partial [Pristionchus fissidentatus]
RYYGQSKLGTNDLQYLTSAQMLYDVAAFIRARQEVEKLTGPWITFGGSYSGNLAAWSRQWFPDLILGAVASSAPVLAKNDFYESLEMVEEVIKRRDQKCYDRTSEAFAKLFKLSQDPAGRKTISDKFELSPAWTGAPDEVIDALDLNLVFNTLYGMYYEVVVYDLPNWGHLTNLCAPMVNERLYPDPIDALRKQQVDQNGERDTSTPSKYDDEINSLIKMKSHVDGKGVLTYSDDALACICFTFAYTVSALRA